MSGTAQGLGHKVPLAVHLVAAVQVTGGAACPEGRVEDRETKWGVARLGGVLLEGHRVDTDVQQGAGGDEVQYNRSQEEVGGSLGEKATVAAGEL